MIFNEKTIQILKAKVLVPSRGETVRRDEITLLPDQNSKWTGFDIVFSNIDLFTIQL